MRIILALISILSLIGCGTVQNERQPSNSYTDANSYLKGSTAHLNFHGKVDFVRKFINKNSRHGDSDYDLDHGIYTIIDSLFDNLKHNTPQNVQMRCFAKSTVMMKILSDLGIESRDVGVWSDTGLPGDWNHNFIEVLNPETGKWEAQDPTFDVFYLLPNGERASALDVVTLPLNSIKPCTTNEKCGWDMPASVGTPEYPIAHLADLQMLDVLVNHGTKQVFINTDRHDVNFVYDFLGTTIADYYSGPSSTWNYQLIFVDGAY